MMKIIDAGHVFELDSLDGGEPQILSFVKREGVNFPFNKGNHPGTNTQEVLRALISRTAYLLEQKPCAETEAAIGNLKSALLHYESRAARRHDRKMELTSIQELICGRTCDFCKHVGCIGTCRDK